MPRRCSTGAETTILWLPFQWKVNVQPEVSLLFFGEAICHNRDEFKRMRAKNRDGDPLNGEGLQGFPDTSPLDL
jgi:hypothetical protein